MCLCTPCVQLHRTLSDALEGLPSIPSATHRTDVTRVVAVTKRFARQLSVNSLFCGSDLLASLRFHLCRRDVKGIGAVPLPDFEAVLGKVLPSLAGPEDIRCGVLSAVAARVGDA